MIKNTIKFTHPDSSIIYHIINSLQHNNDFFNTIRPIPEDVLDKDIEIWCINNWSCKHDIYSYEKFLIEEIDNMFIIQIIGFTTKFNPPSKLYTYMLENDYIIL